MDSEITKYNPDCMVISAYKSRLKQLFIAQNILFVSPEFIGKSLGWWGDELTWVPGRAVVGGWS